MVCKCYSANNCSTACGDYDNMWYPQNDNDWNYQPQWIPPQTPQWPPQPQWPQQPQQPVIEPFDINDWTPDFPTVWDDSMCEDNRHRLYRAIGLPCPCRRKFEEELPKKWSEWFAKRMQKNANKPLIQPQPQPQPWYPQPGPWQPWITTTDNTNVYQPSVTTGKYQIWCAIQ